MSTVAFPFPVEKSLVPFSKFVPPIFNPSSLLLTLSAVLCAVFALFIALVALVFAVLAVLCALLASVTALLAVFCAVDTCAVKVVVVDSVLETL